MKQIRSIALEARKWCDKTNANKVNPFPSDLEGMCAIASAHLFNKLKEAGYTSTIVCNSRHCFVLYEDWIIDITASQFGMDSVLICKQNDRLVQAPEWEQQYKHIDAKSMRTHQLAKRWYDRQIIPPQLAISIQP